MSGLLRDRVNLQGVDAAVIARGEIFKHTEPSLEVRVNGVLYCDLVDVAFRSPLGVAL